MGNQKGSAVVMGVMVMLIAGIMAAGLMPLVTSLTRQAPMNKDALEAQYAAEAGAKRALVEFNKLNLSNWGWLNSDIAFINDVDSKKYNVKIYTDKSSKANVLPEFDEDNTYFIQSTGTVGKARKIVTVQINVKGSSGSGGGSGSNSDDPNYVTNYIMYSGGTVILNGSETLHGKIASNGSITQHGSINSDPPDLAKVLFPNQSNINWLPDFSVLTSKTAADRPVNNNIVADSTGNITLDGGNYNNQTIVVHGNLTIKNNTNFSNTAFYVTGTVTINGGGVNFNNNCYIVAGNDINSNGSINLGGAVFVSYGSIDMGGSGTLNSGAIYAKNDLRIHGSFVLTYGKSEVDRNVDYGGGTASVSVQSGSWSVK